MWSLIGEGGLTKFKKQILSYRWTGVFGGRDRHWHRGNPWKPPGAHEPCICWAVRSHGDRGSQWAWATDFWPTPVEVFQYFTQPAWLCQPGTDTFLYSENTCGVTKCSLCHHRSPAHTPDFTCSLSSGSRNLSLGSDDKDVALTVKSWGKI